MIKITKQSDPKQFENISTNIGTSGILFAGPDKLFYTDGATFYMKDNYSLEKGIYSVMLEDKNEIFLNGPYSLTDPEFVKIAHPQLVFSFKYLFKAINEMIAIIG